MNINFKGDYFNFNFLTKSDWTLSSESMDIVQSQDFVQGAHGQCPDCPLSPWTMSTVSMDNAQGVHWVHRLSTDEVSLS